jgi:hypothetical protein
MGPRQAPWMPNIAHGASKVPAEATKSYDGQLYKSRVTARKGGSGAAFLTTYRAAGLL